MEPVQWILTFVIFALVGLVWWQPWKDEDENGHGSYPSGPGREENRDREQ